jgi:hypothetical protein
VQVRLSGLAPGTVYHYRVVARNALGSTPGADATFSTPSGGASAGGLPDERAYELVSPLGNGEVFQPITDLSAGEEELPLLALEPFRAAADGGAMVYAGDAPASGVGGNGNQSSTTLTNNEYLAGRSGAGWGASDIEPPPAAEFVSSPVYQSFSSDLSTGYLSSPDRPTLAGAPPCGGEDLYARASAGGAFAALFTSTLTGECGRPLFVGASADGSRVFFQTSAALVAPAVPTAGGVGISNFCYQSCNLYESVGGVVSVVNLLPGGGLDTAATFGGPSGNGNVGQGENLPGLSNAISADGSRVVWSDVSTGVIYVRVGGVRTVQVSVGAARFWTASSDGRFVLYSEGERLERFDVETGAREELAGAGAGVQGVVGASEDGSFVYFVANGVLATGATPGSCKRTYPGQPGVIPREEEEAARCGLYVLHVGEPVRFVATLAGSDDNLLHIIDGTGGVGLLGDWQSDLASRTAEVAADGRSVAFSSTLPLTGYDNVGPVTPLINNGNRTPIPELFVYAWEAGGGQLDCASCAPSGVPPTTDLAGSSNSQRLGYELGGWERSSMWESFMGRWFSSDGSRVFFNTAQPLVAQDTNRLTDVYEWERQGAGSCRQAGGCVYLLSGGSSNDLSLFLDASSSGSDAFFMSRAQLVAGDSDDSFHVFDARSPHVPGEAVGFPPVPGAVCSGAGCQGVPQAPPVFGAPSSATFSGAGNLAPPAPVVQPKPRVKPGVCRKGFVKRRGRCVRRARSGSRAKAPGKHAKKGRK